jgi:hypothetical protein
MESVLSLENAIKSLVRSQGVLSYIAIFSVSASYADEMSDIILQQLKAKEFIPELYIDEYQLLSMVDGEYTIMNIKEVEEYFEIAGEQLSETEITSFRIMSRADTKDFTSVTFEYEWTLKIGNTDLNGRISGVGVFLKVGEGYVSIFDAQTS